MKRFYFQGDVCLEKVDDTDVSGEVVPNDPDGATVLARGEEHGHRHAFYLPFGGAVMFRDDGLAREIPDDLYIGHVKLEQPATLKHEEHAAIDLPEGTYRVRRQRREVVDIDPDSQEVRKAAMWAMD